MKYRITSILAVCLLLLCTGCAARDTNSAAETSNVSTTELQTETVQETEIPAETEENTLQVLPAPPTDREILTEIFIADGIEEELAQQDADYMVTKAEQLTQRLLGGITSEEDAIAKAKAILTEIGAENAIDMAESEYVELDGELVKYERNGPCYYVTYIEAADAWRVTPALPSGTTEDGRKVGAPGMPPYVMVRGTDGYVLGIFV